MSTDDSGAAFVRARRGCSRVAKGRWLKAQGTAPGRPDYEPLKAQWERSRWLLGPGVTALCREALTAARGPLLSGHEPFVATMWPDGRQDTHGGVPHEGSILDFAYWLVDRAEVVAEKGAGRVFTPTTNSDGHRANESTLSLHALMLDADGRGGYETIIEVLEKLGYCYVLYESGGHTPELPKWRLVLRLTRPIPTRTEQEREWWKQAYNTARTVFGSLAGLLGEGFDPNTETPCAPWFITEKRTADTPNRQVMFNAGHALDLDKLIDVLPAYPVELKTISRSQQTREIIQREDVQVEAILDALVPPMQKILSDRRDLYLALPGALLDKGVGPEDVLAIVEELSLRCPGDPSYTPAEIDARHREHVHCAETTIRRFEKHATYTRIGTLYDRWPEVVYALDQALPHPMLEWARKMCAGNRVVLPASPAAKQTTARSGSAPAGKPKPNFALRTALTVPTEAELKQLAVAYRNARLKPKEGEEVADKDVGNGFLIKRLLAGNPLVEEDDPEPLQISMASAIARVAGILAYILPSKAPFTTVIGLAFMSLTKKRDFEGDPFEFFQQCYENSLADRLQREAEAKALKDRVFGS